MHRVLPLLIGVFTQLGGSDACISGYVGHGGSCYHFSHDTETWADAMAICKMDDGYLAEINSQLENDFLSKTMINGVAGGGWVGGADLTVEGEWFWWNSRTQLTYTNWRTGEPNNDKQDENCMQFEASGKWNDLPCHNLARYVCELPGDGTEVVG